MKHNLHHGGRTLGFRFLFNPHLGVFVGLVLVKCVRENYIWEDFYKTSTIED